VRVELDHLVACATYSVPGPEATVAIAGERAHLHDLHGRGVVYEVVARPGERLEQLTVRVAGRLAYYARTKRMCSVGAPQITIALFVGDRLHFVPSPALFFGLVAAYQLTPEVLAEHAAAWEQGAVERADFVPV
jgi:hypothetical protein